MYGDPWRPSVTVKVSALVDAPRVVTQDVMDVQDALRSVKTLVELDVLIHAVTYAETLVPEHVQIALVPAQVVVPEIVLALVVLDAAVGVQIIAPQAAS